MPMYSGHAPVRLDGSYGEGGGQILRTAVSLSCVTGRPVEITNIRRGRPRPGLQPQHLTAVKAAAIISRASVEGAELSSTSLWFSPGKVRGGDYVFDVAEKKGSAGSVSLVIQTVLLPLCMAHGPSRMTVLGGTHVPWSPSFHYLKHVFLPMLSRLGVKAEIEIEKWGWYPLGGGEVTVRVIPGKGIEPVIIDKRGRLVRTSGVSAVSNLSMHIAERQKSEALTLLRRRGIDASIEVVLAPSQGKGSFLFLSAESENITAGFDGLGALGKRTERVAEEAVGEFFSYLDSDAALDPHLADQLVHYLALAPERSEFTVSRVTKHLLTNIWVVKQFVAVDIRLHGMEGEAGRVEVTP